MCLYNYWNYVQNIVCCKFHLGILDAFSVGRNLTASGSNMAVSFNDIFETQQSNFNETTMSLFIPASPALPLYWMHIAVDAPASTATTLFLSDLSMSVNVNQTTTSVAVTLAMSGVVKVQPGAQLNLIASTNTSATFWSAYRIDNLFCPLIAFRVVRSTPLTTQSLITFDTVLVNEGNAWNSVVNDFVAPAGGIYMFSFSGGIRFQMGIVLNLFCNGVMIRRAGGGYGDVFASGYDTLSRTALLSLKASDVVNLTLSQKSYLYSDSTNFQISFSGFYYSPVSRQQVSAKINEYRRCKTL